MKLLCLLSVLLIAAQSCSAFVVQNPTTAPSCLTRHTVVVQMAAVELFPEPEGGEELFTGTSITGCRMKQMEVEPIDKKSEDGPVYKFWMTAEAEAKLIKEYRAQLLRDASKKANFPGFRKGQVPPYAQPQITQFAVQESIMKTVEAAVVAYGLKSLAGSDGEVNVKENVADLAKAFKTGDSITFTATLDCAYDPLKTRYAPPAKEEVVVDVEVTTTEAAETVDVTAEVAETVVESEAA